MNPTRRSFARLTLLTAAAFSLRPRHALASLERKLEPDFSATMEEDVLKMTLAVVSREKADLEISFSDPFLQVEIINGSSRHPISPWEMNFTTPGPLAEAKRASMSRARMRVSWTRISRGSTTLAVLAVPWPEGVPRDDATRIAVIVNGTTAEVPFTLTDDLALETLGS